MTTLAALSSSILADLGDPAGATWTVAQVQAWILDALREISRHYPRLGLVSISTQAGVRTYNLPGDFLDALAVEYPAGQEPPVYLTRRLSTTSGFYQSPGSYDFNLSQDASSPSQIVLSASPLAGQSISVLYTATHDTALSASDELSVPEVDLPILSACVTWRATSERLGLLERSPEGNQDLIAQLRASVQRAWTIYNDLLRSSGGQSQVSGPLWMDKYDRVY
jgi:hypothetical protein